MKKVLSVLMAICFILIATSCNSNQAVSSQITSNEDNSSQITIAENESSNSEVMSSQTEGATNSNTTTSNNPVSSNISTSSKANESPNSEVMSSQTEGTTNSNTTTSNNPVSSNISTSSKASEDKLSTSTSSKGAAVHSHKFINATCTKPAKCVSCGVTSGSKLGHSYSKGICTKCGHSNRDPNKIYDWGEACDVRGYGLPHVMSESTKCLEYLTCTFCNKTTAEHTGHSYAPNGKCAGCGKQLVNLTIEHSNKFTFEGLSTEYRDYYFHPAGEGEEDSIEFNFKPIPNFQSMSVFIVKISFYDKNNVLILSETPKLREDGHMDFRYATTFDFPKNTTKIVLESIH